MVTEGVKSLPRALFTPEFWKTQKWRPAQQNLLGKLEEIKDHKNKSKQMLNCPNNVELGCGSISISVLLSGLVI